MPAFSVERFFSGALAVPGCPGWLQTQLLQLPVQGGKVELHLSGGFSKVPRLQDATMAERYSPLIDIHAC